VISALKPELCLLLSALMTATSCTLATCRLLPNQGDLLYA